VRGRDNKLKIAIVGAGDVGLSNAMID